MAREQRTVTFRLSHFKRRLTSLESKKWRLTATENIRLFRDGEKGGKGVWRWGKREIIYLSLHCHHQNDSCVKVGSDESHFNLSYYCEGQSHKTASTDHNFGRERRAEAGSKRHS